jgi:hypothetical protein
MFKTGTTSLGVALEILGYRTKYKFWRLIKDDWTAYFDLDPNRWSRFESEIRREADKYDAFADAPWLYLYEELDRWYPGSKFILTLRKDAQTVAESDFRMWKRSGFLDKLVEQGDQVPTLELFIRRYEEHNARVLAYFENRIDDLLVVCWETEERPWERLCQFLGCLEVPEQPFPHANRASTGRSHATRVLSLATQWVRTSRKYLTIGRSRSK